MTLIPTGQTDRRLPGEPATITLQPAGSTGEPYSLTGPAGFQMIDGAGAVVVDGEAVLAADHASLSIELAAGTLTTLDTYEIHWTAGVGGATLTWSSQLEVCGGYLVGVAALRAAQRDMAAMDVARLIAARTVAEQLFEKEAHVAFVPRGARALIGGDGRQALILPHVALRDVLSLSLRATPSSDAVAMTAAQIAALEKREAGMLLRPDDVWPVGSVVEVHYAHGYDAPPADVADAVTTLAVEYAKPSSGLPARATAQTTEVGTFRIAIAGRDGATGIPNVDAAIDRYRRDLPAVG